MPQQHLLNLRVKQRWLHSAEPNRQCVNAEAETMQARAAQQPGTHAGATAESASGASVSSTHPGSIIRCMCAYMTSLILNMINGPHQPTHVNTQAPGEVLQPRPCVVACG